MIMGLRQLVGDGDVLRVITQNRMIMGCFRHGSLESRIGCAKCGNIGSIEKRLLIYKGDKNRECFADIAKPAMIEFAAHPDCPALSATASARRAKKMKLQPRFNALASILQGLFIADSARRYVRRRLGGDGNRSESCFIWRYWRKKSPNSNPKAESVPISLFFPVISRRFPFPNPYFKYQWGYVSRQNCAASLCLKVFEPVYCCFKPHIFCHATTIFALQAFARRQCGRHLEVIGKTIIGRVALKGGAAVRRQ